MKLSVVILTKNEEGLIKTCLESVKWADEIIIIDGGSTDKTLEIAKKYTSRITFGLDEDFAVRRNKGMEEAKGEWVLYIDCDERVLQPLKEEIEEILKNGGSSAYAISRKNIIFGREVNYGPYKNDWMIRLFKKDEFVTWVGKVHEYAKFKGKLSYIKNPLLHLTHRDIDQIVLKSLAWSKIDAKLKLESNHPSMSGWRFIRILITELIKQGIQRRGFFNGTVGVMDSILQAFSMFITYVRLWQMQNTKSLNDIYRDIDKRLIEENFKY